MPTKLVEPCILAGTSERGCCSECLAPWRRVIERSQTLDPSLKGSRFDTGKTGENGQGRVQEGERYLKMATGWEPTCTHDTDPIPCTVLDPFAGSGTVLRVAVKHRRNAIGIELNPDYVTLIEKRLNVQQTLPLDAAS
jgi:hypothetical protein